MHRGDKLGRGGELSFLARLVQPLGGGLFGFLTIVRQVYRLEAATPGAAFRRYAAEGRQQPGSRTVIQPSSTSAAVILIGNARVNSCS